ncbi:uncharacterized protein BJ171DRAFT_496605 [Polychytrium aggregatum]|uniref:uncharacterized protein n=1 Tax=Polychytrium aggregatum TaxID=110093 RepID=UPI0022FEF078|nr:uncharacterized protein BJ171DRAFT_496605 [Polychytrium aggregatum]KAI9206693.1 hypothetical protein BJ171DRAFT_496605 [Polychytrium aggregatum]
MPAVATLTPEQKDRLVKEFQELDQDHDGKVSAQDVIAHLQRTHQGLTGQALSDEVTKFIRRMDYNHDSVIEEHEYLLIGKRKLRKELLLQKFNEIDADHSGFVSLAELKSVWGVNDDTAQDIRELFEKVYAHADRNQDGHISFGEFSRLDEKLESLFELA